MQNSLIFFKKSKTGKHSYVAFDCCETLGRQFSEIHTYGNTMYVAIPIIEMDEFFMNRESLDAYLGLITQAYGVSYELSDNNDEINFDNCGYQSSELIVIKITSLVRLSNKHFNVAYNTMRYLWYRHYTNMAIIATNLYRLELLDDAFDILAIAFSYQETTGRAVLPFITSNINGLLFFRPFKNIIAELEKNDAFNSIFYKYPIYFNPKVKVMGSFFEDYTITLEAKELFSRLVGIQSPIDVPGSMMNNLRIICKDYLAMKELYYKIIKDLSDKNLVMSKENAVLLSTDMTEVNIITLTATGSSKTITFKV